MCKRFKIVVDSSSDLTKDYLQDEAVDFDVIPLTICVGEKEFVDNGELNVDTMLSELKAYDGKTSSSCPSPASYMESFAGAEYVFCITISSKLSGSYNSAMLTRQQSDNGGHILVIDSKATSGTMVLIVDELVRLIHAGLDFEDISKRIMQFTEKRSLYFVLDNFDNMVKNGRVNKALAFIAMVLKIKPLCYACEGEVKVLQKVRTRKSAIARLIELISKEKPDYSQDDCVISYCRDSQTATFIQDTLSHICNFRKIQVMPMRGLCSYYALENGIIVSF